MKLFKAEQYQPRCRRVYLHYFTLLSKVLPEVKIEHIGASEIPNAISKGDLDIYVAVDQAEFDHAQRCISALGFEKKLDSFHSKELCMFESKIRDDVVIQRVVKESRYDFFLQFRDQLISSAHLRQQYNALKCESAHLELEQYRERKSIFIQNVLTL